MIEKYNEFTWFRMYCEENKRWWRHIPILSTILFIREIIKKE